MSARTAMAIGTAGFTAMPCVLALQQQCAKPDQVRGRLIVDVNA